MPPPPSPAALPPTPPAAPPPPSPAALPPPIPRPTSSLRCSPSGTAGERDQHALGPAQVPLLPHSVHAGERNRRCIAHRGLVVVTLERRCDLRGGDVDEPPCRLADHTRHVVEARERIAEQDGGGQPGGQPLRQSLAAAGEQRSVRL